MRHVSLLLASLLLAAPLSAQEWHAWSPRPEVAPTVSRDGDALVLEGGGNPAVFGGWEREFPVRGGQWYRLRVDYDPSGLELELLQAPVRLDWTASDGSRVGQPDYAWRVAGRESRTVVAEAPAPERAARVKVQLLVQGAPRARIRWRDVSLSPIETPGPRAVRVAAIRLRPKGPDPLARFVALVASSVPAGTDLIVLPEGVTLVGTDRRYDEVAQPIPGPDTRRLGAMAHQANAWVVAGVYERDGDVLYNTAVLIDRAGQIAGKYRKVYLPREELEGGLTPGHDYPVFDTEFGRVGLMICWDVQYADPARALALRGAEVIAMPIWGGNEALARARAIENHLFLVSSGYDFPTLVFDPVGDTLARAEVDGSIALATLDLNRRYTDPWLGDMRGRFFRELRLDLPVTPDRSH